MSPLNSFVSISNILTDPTRPCFKPSPDAMTGVCPLLEDAELTSILKGLPANNIFYLLILVLLQLCIVL